MPKIVIHGGVLKGRHAYNDLFVGVGNIYECFRELNNPVDENAFVVRNQYGSIIGHVPTGVSDHFQCMFENKQADITIFW